MTPARFFDPSAPVQPDQYQAEFDALLAIYRSLQPHRVLEIGVREGGSLYQWLKNAPRGAEICVVDQPGLNWGCPVPPDVSGWYGWAGRFSCRLSVHLGDSHEEDALEFIAENAPFDFVFIDGDHSAAGVLMDVLAVAGCTRVIALHDIYPDATDGKIEIWRVWPFLRRMFPDNAELTSEDNQQSRGIGVLYV